MLAENMGCGFMKRGYETSLPSLAIVDTEEVLEKIGEKWSLPEPFGRHVYNTDLFKDHGKSQFQIYCDEIFTDWINYCNGALRGMGMVNRFKNEGIISGDSTSVEYYDLFLKTFPGEADMSKTITSILSAFSILLSDEARKK